MHLASERAIAWAGTIARPAMRGAAAALLAMAALPAAPAAGQRRPGQASCRTVRRWPSAFQLLPLGSIKPRGWLRRQLEIQASGLGGRLDESWPDLGPDSGRLGGAGESWERGPYFTAGLVPLAFLLEDPKIRQRGPAADWEVHPTHGLELRAGGRCRSAGGLGGGGREARRRPPFHGRRRPGRDACEGPAPARLDPRSG